MVAIAWYRLICLVLVQKIWVHIHNFLANWTRTRVISRKILLYYSLELPRGWNISLEYSADGELELFSAKQRMDFRLNTRRKLSKSRHRWYGKSRIGPQKETVVFLCEHVGTNTFISHFESIGLYSSTWKWWKSIVRRDHIPLCRCFHHSCQRSHAQVIFTHIEHFLFPNDCCHFQCYGDCCYHVLNASPSQRKLRKGTEIFTNFVLCAKFWNFKEGWLLYKEEYG